MFFEEPLTEWFFVEPKMASLWRTLLSTFIFKSVALFWSELSL